MTPLDDQNPKGSWLTLEFDLPASPGTVYDAFTQADWLTRWWSAAAQTDCKPSGKYKLEWPEAGYMLDGEYLEAARGARLVFTWKWTHEANAKERSVWMTFSATSSGTRIRLEQGKFSDTPEEQIERRKHLEGWNHFLPKLEKALQNQPASAPNPPKPSGEATPIDQLMLESEVQEAIRTVYDPEIPVNIYELGLIYDVRVSAGGNVEIDMTLTSPACPAAQSLPGEVETKVRAIDGVTDVNLQIVWEPAWTPDRMSEAAKLELGLF